MMVVGDDPERAICIDFDRSQTFDLDTLTKEQREWMVSEVRVVSGIGRDMVSVFVVFSSRTASGDG